MNKEDIKSFLRDNVKDSTCLNEKIERLDNYFKQDKIKTTDSEIDIAILKTILLCFNEGETVDIKKIEFEVEKNWNSLHKKFNKTSLNLNDKCFNKCNNAGCVVTDKGNFEFNINEYNAKPHFFEKTDAGFKIISEYNGPIVEKHRDVPDKIVAYWQDGQIVENIYSTGLLEETIIKYVKYKNSEEYDEQYKYDYANEHKGLFNDLDDFEEKITNLKHENFKPYFFGCSGLRHLTNNYMNELKEAFRVLFSNDELENRLRTFKNILNEKLINDENWRNNETLVDVQTASYFLFINDYENNLLFTKMKPFNKFAKMFGLLDLEKYESDEERYIKWQEYCKNTLLPKMDEVLNKKHTLLDAQDLIWFVWNNRKDKTTKEEEQNEDKEPMEELNIPKNQILYGPPGTGKTYNTVIKAMEIINKDCIEYDNEGDVRNYDVVKKEFDKLKESGQIEFVTFHQSYSYEEFVEGIKPKLNSNDLGYIREDGIFKNICNTSKEIKEIKSEQIYDFDNLSVYKILIPDPNLFEYCIANDCVAIGWGEDIDISNCTSVQEISNKIPENYEHKNQCISQLNLFKNWIDRDLKEGREVIIVIPNSMTSIKGIAKVTGEYYFNDEIENGSQRRPVEWLRTNVNIDSENIYSAKFVPPTITGMYPEKINKESFLNLINNQNKKDNKNCVLIIDEINRGDVSKIFGELITLIEEDKRLGAKYAMTTTLPYSKKSFGVPSNLFIIGTMNTADRSIALLDTALRRRFDFEEMMPRPELLKNREVKDINLQTLLTRINERIEKEYDRDHQIGHSYLMGVNDEKDLERAYKNRILPLLNEYFYNDAESVAKILNCKVEELKDDFLKVLKNAQSNDNNKQ